MDRRHFLAAGTALALSPLPVLAQDGAGGSGWRLLPTEPYRGKQDDIAFIDRMTGWYGNGLGKLFKTTDGGETWVQQLDQPGTYVRALGFVDAQTGFLGNIGPGYFPTATDPVPLYRTRDGGETWQPVEISGPALVGLCAIDVLRVPFINAGVLDHRVVVRAGGRVGGPALLAESVDGGETFTSRDLSDLTAMIQDVKFIDGATGFIAGASSVDISRSSGVILKTDDGGRTWRKVYQSSRPWELTWKISFPSEQTGYVSLQSYNPDPTASVRYVLKTTDGGDSWSEVPMVDNAQFRPFGIGFVTEELGWVGGVPGGLETRDGGQTWQPVSIGPAVNKIRVVRDDQGVSVFAIGAQVHRLDLPA